MESSEYRLEALCQESVVRPAYARQISPSRKHSIAKQSRKSSMVSLHDEEKPRRKPSKYRSSLGAATDHLSDIQRFGEACSLKLNDDDDHLSSFDELPSEYENKSDDVVQHSSQILKLEEEELNSSKREKNLDDGVNVSVKDKVNSTAEEEEEQKGASSAEKFAQNEGVGVTGVMNLSSMNLTDQDIPMVIQRAFGQKKKKCIGFILRDNALTSEGVKTLVDSLLDQRTKLQYLSFADNANIGDEGIVHLTRLLQKNRSMNFLAVPNTGITDRGVRILADTLCCVNADSSCAPLEKLYLSFNQGITDESLGTILQIIERNRTLKLLAVRCCGLSDKARRRLRQLYEKLKKRKFSLAE